MLDHPGVTVGAGSSAMAETNAGSAPAVRARRRSARLRKPGIAVGLAGVVLALIVLAAILAPVLSPHDPLKVSVLDRLKPPAWVDGGTTRHLLGTDSTGRDILSRLLHGIRYSLVVGLAAVALGGLVGVLAGIIGGYYDGRLPAFVFARLADIQQAIPFVILALAVAASVGASFRNLILILGLGSWLFFYRIVRGETLVLREVPFIDSVRSIGASDLTVIFRHVLPNVLPSVIVVATIFVPRLIMFAAALSFLGLGVQPPRPELGLMIAEGRDFISRAWWITVFPGSLLAILVLSLNTLGDWLRDSLDPTQRRREH